MQFLKKKEFFNTEYLDDIKFTYSIYVSVLIYFTIIKLVIHQHTLVIILIVCHKYALLKRIQSSKLKFF